MNLEWLLSQVFSYLGRFSKALVSPRELLECEPSSAGKNTTEAMIFLALSAAISLAGLSFVVNLETDLMKSVITFALSQILVCITVTLALFGAWKLSGCILSFDVFLRGTAYFVGVYSVLTTALAIIFVGAVSSFHPSSLGDARLAIWTVLIRPEEIWSQAFPESWADKFFVLSVVAVYFVYVLLVWWRAYKSMSGLGWLKSAWAFITYSCLVTFFSNLILSFVVKLG